MDLQFMDKYHMAPQLHSGLYTEWCYTAGYGHMDIQCLLVQQLLPKSIRRVMHHLTNSSMLMAVNVGTCL